MDQKNIALLAQELDTSLRSCMPVTPITDRYPDIHIEDAYQIQMENVRRQLDKNNRITGKKIGLTSRPMQEMFQVNEPDYGHLFASMVSEDGIIRVNSMLQPKVEAEIAFVLKEDVTGPDATIENVLQATDYVVAALEIVDSRIKDWKIKLPDTVADNASSGMYVLGNTKIRPESISLPDVDMSFYKNGQLANRGKGTAVLGDPAYCVSWLANKLFQFGVVLKKGEVVLSGALSAAVEAKAGDCFEAQFSELGSVTVEFV